MERHVLELYDPVMRCTVFAAVSAATLIDASVRCPHAERYNESASKPGVAAVAGEKEALWYGRAIVCLRDLWKTGRRGHQAAA